MFSLIPQAPVGPSIQSIGSGLLGAFYAAQRAGLAASTSSLAQGPVTSGQPKTTPPWDVTLDQPELEDRLRLALSGRDIFSLEGTSFGAEAVPEDQKTLFSLYKALDSLQAIAAHASKKTTSDLELPGFDRRFQDHLTELLTRVSEAKTSSYTLVSGTVSKKAESGVGIEQQLSQHTTKIMHRGAFDAPLANLTGTEVFTVSVLKGGVSTDVVMDLSEVSGTLTLDALVSYMNGKLAAAGSVSTFSRERIVPPADPDADEDEPAALPDTWGLKINGVATEVLSFSAATGSTAVYLAGESGRDETTSATFLKFGGVDAGAPTLDASARVTAEEAAARAGAIARDASGALYVVGTAEGDTDGKPVKGDQDVFLSKFDSTGQLVWQRLLGAAQSADGFAVAVDPSGNVVIAGSVTGELSTTSVGGGTDAFVTKYSTRGEELFTRQLAPILEDEAYALTVDAAGDIYVGGMTKGGIASGFSSAGGRDATLTKLSADGTLVYNRQTGTSGDDRTTALGVAADGGLLVASIEDGIGILRKYDAADGASAPQWEVTLGDLAAGTISGIAVDGNAIYLGGFTANASLDAGGTESLNGSLQGAQDGFVMRIDDAGASATAAYTTYLGTGATDRIRGIAVAGGEVYVAGNTQGDFGTGKIGTVDGFFARLDSAGTVELVHQFGGREGFASANGIAVDATGSSVLDALGLPQGRLDYTEPRDLISQGSVRPGDYFYVSVDGGRQRKISIEAGETFRSLSFKINRVLLLDGKAEVRRVNGEEVLRIRGEEGVRIDIQPGEGERDALAGIGLKAGTILDKGLPLPDEDASEEEETDAAKIFGLNLPDDLSLLTKTEAARASEALLDALTVIRKVFREITKDPALDALLKQQGARKGPVPAYLSAQVANYQAGLTRLEAGGGSSTLGLF